MDVWLSGVFLSGAAACLLVFLWLLYRSVASVGAESSMERRRAPVWDAREALLQKKHAVIEGLRDLQQDHAMGKLTEEDFRALEHRLRSEAKEVLARLDALVQPYRGKADAIIARTAQAVEEQAVEKKGQDNHNAEDPPLTERAMQADPAQDSAAPHGSGERT